jgi:hypothetical protein
VSSIIKVTGIIPQKVLLKALGILDFGTWEHAYHAPLPSHGISDVLMASLEVSLNEEVALSTRNDKAAKNDDAPVPEYLWDDVIVPDGNHEKVAALSVIRVFALR